MERGKLVKLWKISQSVNNDYDTFDSAVVSAETPDDARQMHPRGWTESDFHTHNWAEPSQVEVELIGEAVPGAERGVIVASFNAG